VRSQGRAFSHGFAELYSYEQVRELCAVGVELGCTSLNFHDSFFRMGIHPEAIKYFIRKIRRDVPAHPPLIVHLSNFFGHATMTAVAALTAGASAVDVCMNAVGHHCGHTSLPEVVMTLESLYGVRTGIQLDQIRHVAELVERETGIHKQSNQPIIGEFAFAMDGAYWSLEADKPYDQRVHAIYPFSPEVIGAEERVVWSERSVMPESVGARLQLLGLSHDATAIEQILAVLAARLASKQDFPNWMLDEEFTALCRETLQAPARRQ
jgi:isopropylmalate/homocitrate/citramalate synthase